MFGTNDIYSKTNNFEIFVHIKDVDMARMCFCADRILLQGLSVKRERERERERAVYRPRSEH